MKTATRSKVNIELRDEWLQSVSTLTNQIAVWIYDEPGWSIEEIETKEIDEPPLGSYTVSFYEIEMPAGQLRIEPIARNYPGRGIIDLYAWPTSYRVRLIQDGNGGWRVLTDSGIYLHQSWSRENFVILVRELAGAEDMIPI